MSKNNYSKQIERYIQREVELRLMNDMQLAMDAAIITANEVLGMGKGRAAAFCNEFIKTCNEIAEMLDEDSKSDKELEYSKTVLDRRLHEIVGDEVFKPFDERYGRCRL